MLAFKDRDRVRLVSRNGRDHTRRFAVPGRLHREVVPAHARARRRGRDLRPAPPLALRLAEGARPGRRRLAAVLMAFDLLYHERRDLAARPLRDRRARLEDVVANNDLVFPVRRLAPDGLEAWKQVTERGYEGYVAKDEASATRAGRRGGG
jgi:ATP-dependent DNA ligase